MKKFSSGCTLDCFDCCKFNVYSENNKVIKVEGDKDHPFTKGFICKKGHYHLKRTYHKDRQYTPLLKVNGKWQEISFEKALQIMADKLDYYKNEAGLQSILYYEQYGSGSILKSIGDIFFNFFGGCMKQKGGPCWSAGMAAQKKNFGTALSSSIEDMMNSKNIIIWGKNPAYTSIHTMAMIKKAKLNGSYVIVIDPINTVTAKMADLFINIKPNSDGALALAMAKKIIESGKTDDEYIEKHVKGYEEYKSYVMNLELSKLLQKCGISEDTLDILVDKYTELYSIILLGYGLQRYKNGGNTIMLIDALPAITGQMGKSGGGINYANKIHKDTIKQDPFESEKYADNTLFNVSEINSAIHENKVKMAVIVKSNLVNQLPDSGKLSKSIENIDFTVCFDQFMTDTAKLCDLFIPVTTVFESEDILFSSMTNPYIIYNEKVVEPKDERMDEYEFFKKLASLLKIKDYPYVTKHEYLSRVIEPLKKIEPNMSLEFLRDNYFTVQQDVAWKDNKFRTPSGKIELYFDENINYEDDEMCRAQEGDLLRLITAHSKDSLFSQHFMDFKDKSKVYINSKMAEIRGLKDGEEVYLESERGRISVMLSISDDICNDTCLMYAGFWKKHGNPNYIIKSDISDIGGQVAYNEAKVKINTLQ